jgi:Skp family chaperone for outer membrane proteins
MKCLFKIFILYITVITVSCTTGNNISSEYVIRYINLNSIYEYIYNNSNDAQNLKRETDSLIKKIDEMENSDGAVSKVELNHYRSELAKLREQEKNFKAETFVKIKTAVGNIAAKHNADFILNSGDGVVYSKPVYDLTYEVIKEYKSLNNRSSLIYK